MADLERNKRTVLTFYDLMFNQCRPREAIVVTRARSTSSTIHR
jgi:hypothetical protein